MLLTGYVCLYVFKSDMSSEELLTVEGVEDFVFVASMFDKNLFCTKAPGAVGTEKILGNILAILESLSVFCPILQKLPGQLQSPSSGLLLLSGVF